MENTPTIDLNTPRGVVRVATPEATALELVGYPRHVGGIGPVVTVLAELAEVMRPKTLRVAAARAPIAWVQRLGYLLEVAGQEALATSVRSLVRKEAIAFAPLVRGSGVAGSPRVESWKLIVNAEVEPEL